MFVFQALHDLIGLKLFQSLALRALSDIQRSAGPRNSYLIKHWFLFLILHNLNGSKKKIIFFLFARTIE